MAQPGFGTLSSASEESWQRDIEDPRLATAKKTSGSEPQPPVHVHGPDCDHDHGVQDVLQPYRREQQKIGRNDPCHCGSGKKYKKCHGAAD